MSGILTSDEIAFLEKMKNEKKSTWRCTKELKEKKIRKGPTIYSKIKWRYEKFQWKKQNKYALIKKKVLSEVPP